jgi:ankyrin repeat protein
MSKLLDALYRGDAARVSELLAEDRQLDVCEAAAFGRTDRLRELLDDHPTGANAFGDDGFQPLGLACFFGHAEAARLLLDRGADPNSLARNEHIQAGPLHSAAASENKDEATRYELCELLLDHDADPNNEQGGGFTALDSARQNGDERLERLLLDRGARSGERRLDGAH